MTSTGRLLGVLGFYELDDNGTIRYLRTLDDPAGGYDSLIGEDFFETIGLKNCDELRRQFRRFVESREAADSFPFDCLIEDGIVHTKISLTRAFSTEAFPPERIVMVSIRESGN